MRALMVQGCTSSAGKSRLADAYELLVIEGAGSPAEINLAEIDLANLAVARRPEARVLLIDVADTVTEMVKVRHPYDRGVRASRGIDL